MHAVIHAADIQDRDGGVLVMATLFGLYPFLLKLYADGGYQGPQFKAALQRVMRQVNLEIVKRSDAAKTFIVLPKRWIVERTIGWLNRCRRLAKDWECLNRNALRFPALGLNPPHVKKALSVNNMISDRLLGGRHAKQSGSISEGVQRKRSIHIHGYLRVHAEQVEDAQEQRA